MRQGKRREAIDDGDVKGFYTHAVVATPAAYLCPACGALLTLPTGPLPPDFRLRADCHVCRITYAFEVPRVHATKEEYQAPLELQATGPTDSTDRG